ncbi:metallophosphoesterase [Bradyrhizobium sp. CCGB12]|uniref:metallophosphoesterase family protein n=1 Tax=Bradyrhizobium sp. CCGB12 TaxID=2949632 RepID=UPI0020B22387|nr:metallophosphoesterase [Bradyrhizobium sp. CCGB12]MCP3393067.1 metallophosphoesterase [Bradyrhizobium sp. CCGB12]
MTDRSFVIVQISDLHLDGNGTYSGAVDVLVSTIREKMQRFEGASDRILLITGDLVDSPSASTFKEAKGAIEKFRATGTFTDIRAIAGNHDVKRMGLVFKNDAIYQELSLPRHSENKYYPNSGLDLVLLDSNGASFAAKGEIQQATYDAIVANSHNLALGLKDSIPQRAGQEFAVMRVLALHHHPLPQAAGEGKTVFGIPDEPLMYLVSPATFLAAAISLECSLILHGHRHVQGLTRYSIPRHLSARAAEADEFWQDLYVLSCPSSTGHGGDDAGFNIIHLNSAFRNRRAQYTLEITRFNRSKNAGVFSAVDIGQPNGVIKLPIGRDIYRDPAFQVAVEMSANTEMKRAEAINYARKLLIRRAFYGSTESSWAHGLYTFLVTYHVWEDLLNKFTNAGFARDLDSFQKIRMRLQELISISSEVLGITGPELDNLRSKPLINHDRIIDDLPQNPAPGVDVTTAQKRRRAAIQAINAKMKELGVDLGLGAKAPEDVQA